MLHLLATLILTQGKAQAETFQRINLPNGAMVLARRMPMQTAASIQVFASSKIVPEAPPTHGYRHLLEHLMARSANVDGDLERAGGMLFARTSRDCMQFEINLPSAKVDVGFDAVKKLLTFHPILSDQITREASTIRQEAALVDAETKLADAAWAAAYGADGLSPMGSLDVISAATPDDLDVVRSATFSGPCVVAVVVGDIDPFTAANALADALSGLPGNPGLPIQQRGKGKPGSVETEVVGEARASLAGAFDRPSAAAELAAGFALASSIRGAFVAYTPTLERGLVTIGSGESNPGISAHIDGLKREQMEPLFQRGKALARHWYDTQLGTACSAASLRGRLLCADHGADPEQFLRQLNALTLEDFLEAVRAFQGNRGVSVEGAQK